MSRAKRWLHRYLSARVRQARQAKDGVARKRWQQPGKGRDLRHKDLKVLGKLDFFHG